MALLCFLLTLCGSMCHLLVKGYSGDFFRVLWSFLRSREEAAGAIQKGSSAAILRCLSRALSEPFSLFPVNYTFL